MPVLAPNIPRPGLELVQHRLSSLVAPQPLSQNLLQSQVNTNFQLGQASQAAAEAKRLRTQFNKVGGASEIDRTNYNRALSGLSPLSQPSSLSGQVGNYDDNRYNQIANWARQGGWAEKDIPMAIAISMAESGGNPSAVNRANRNGSVDTGLFQVNSIHRNGASAGLNLFDPVQNAKAALNVFKQSGGRWDPWSTFKNGAYNRFLRQPSGVVDTKIQPFAATTLNGTLRQNAVNVAKTAIGVPYVWGGNSLKNGVDCSGLVQQVYQSLGINMPRTADQLAHQAIGTRTSISNLRPGDLVAWQGGWRGPNYVGHIAIYVGGGQIIEAPYTGANVRQRALKSGEQAFGVALHFTGE